MRSINAQKRKTGETRIELKIIHFLIDSCSRFPLEEGKLKRGVRFGGKEVFTPCYFAPGRRMSPNTIEDNDYAVFLFFF